MGVSMPMQLKFSAKAVFEAFFSANQPLTNKKVTFLVQLIKLRSREYNITLSIHCNYLLRVFSHEEMLAKNYVIKDAACTENVTNWMWLSRHIFDVDDLWSHIAGSSTPHKKIVRIIGNCCQPEIDDYWFFTQYNVIRLKITVNHIFTCHLG